LSPDDDDDDDDDDDVNDELELEKLDSLLPTPLPTIPDTSSRYFIDNKKELSFSVL